MRLGVGLTEGTREGEEFVVLNSTTREEWGVLRALQVEENTSVCEVSDRTNQQFWESLESRIYTNPTLPPGITIMRTVPEGFSDFVNPLVRVWGG